LHFTKLKIAVFERPLLPIHEKMMLRLKTNRALNAVLPVVRRERNVARTASAIASILPRPSSR